MEGGESLGEEAQLVINGEFRLGHVVLGLYGERSRKQLAAGV